MPTAYCLSLGIPHEPQSALLLPTELLQSELHASQHSRKQAPLEKPRQLTPWDKTQITIILGKTDFLEGIIITTSMYKTNHLKTPGNTWTWCSRNMCLNFVERALSHDTNSVGSQTNTLKNRLLIMFACKLIWCATNTIHTHIYIIYLYMRIHVIMIL